MMPIKFYNLLPLMNRHIQKVSVGTLKTLLNKSTVVTVVVAKICAKTLQLILHKRF